MRHLARNVKVNESISRNFKTEGAGTAVKPCSLIHRLHHCIGNRNVQDLFKSGVIQRKLQIGVPNNKYEQKTDQVMCVQDSHLQRQPTEVEPEQNQDKDPTAELLQNAAGNPFKLRRLVTNSGLGSRLSTIFKGGPQDETLNQLLSQAFPGLQEVSSAEEIEEREKDPTDPVPLPAAKSHTKTLSKGVMKWILKAINHSEARCDIDFKPDKTKVEANAVSFVQTVLNKLGTKMAYAGGTLRQPDRMKSTYGPFEDPTEKRRIDHVARSEDDPFYGAEWDAANKKWKSEGGGTVVGKSTKGTSSSSAKMSDSPSTGMGREGKGTKRVEFETVPTVLETGQPLGSLKWGYQIKDQPQAPIELLWGTKADCVDTPSKTVGTALEQFYKAKFDAILDSFDINKAKLKSHHLPLLDMVATKMKGDTSLTAQLGGAADLTGSAEYNKKLGLKRAEAAKDYLVKKGVDAGRLTTVTYGFDWARVKTERGKNEPKNRRVQVWVK